MATTHRALVGRFSRGVLVLRAVLPQIAVHRKVLEYTIGKFRLWAEEVSATPRDDICTPEEISAGNEMILTLSTLRSMMLQYSMQCWIEPTLTNPVHLFLTQMQAQFRDSQATAGVFGTDALRHFQVNEDEWIAPHIADLRAIRASFSQFLQSDHKTPEYIQRIHTRIAEIDQYISEHMEYDKDNSRNLYSAVSDDFRKWFVDIRDFQILEEIGFGMTAHVFKGIDKRTGMVVAIKHFKEAELYGPGLQFFQREVSVLAKCAESNVSTVLKLIGVTNTNPLCIITEFMPNGALNSLLRDPKRKVSPLFKTMCAYDIARGMAYLHSRKIVHRDLKSLNILLDAKFHVKICDFGFARYCNQDDPPIRAGNLGTVHWMAPEVIERKGSFDFSVDVYAYGILLYELVSQTRPFDGMAGDEIKEFVVKGGRPRLPFDLNPRLRKLIEECWDANPEKRPTFVDIVQRFQSLSTLLDGTDASDFSKYLREVAKEEGDCDAADMLISQLLNGHMSLEDAVHAIEGRGIPPTKIHAMWDVIPYLMETCKDRKSLATLISFFFETVKLKDALECLRGFPPGSVPENIAMKLAKYLPSDDPEIEVACLVICCRNGVADAALLKLREEKAVTLALESCARVGVRSVSESEVVRKCVELLEESENEWVIIGALRVLICVKEFTVVNRIRIVEFLSSSNEAVRKLAAVILVGAGMNRVEVGREVIDALLAKWKEEGEASEAVAALCYNLANAEYILSRVEPEMTDANIKVWMIAQSHVDLRERVRTVVEPLIGTSMAIMSLRKALGLDHN